MAKKPELLKAIYNAIQWDRLYEALPHVTRQQVDEFFQELSEGLGQEGEVPKELAARIAGGEVWVCCDGASRGNPGPAGIGVVLATPEGREVLAWGASIGRATNNVAEYRAVIEGLKKARELNARRVRILSDSELLVRQLQGAYKVKSPGLKPLHEQVTELLRGFDQWHAARVTREQSAKADALATQHARPAGKQARNA